MQQKRWGKEYRAHQRWIEESNRKAEWTKQILNWHKTEWVGMLVAAKLAGVHHKRIAAWQAYTPAEAYKNRRWINEIIDSPDEFKQVANDYDVSGIWGLSTWKQATCQDYQQALNKALEELVCQQMTSTT